MLQNPESQKMLDRIEASYQNAFDKEAVILLMQKYYKNLGVDVPKIVCVENLEEAYSAAESAAWSAARSAAWSAAESAAWSAARSAAWSAARSAAWSAAESAARSAAESAAWSAARSAAESAARSAAWSAARSAAESAAYLNGGAHIPEVLKFVEIEAPLLEAVEKGLGWFFPMQDQLILVPFPKVSLNAEKLPNSDSRKAIEWPDGEGFYFLNGVQFPQELWQKVVSKEMPFAEILAIVDTDQRTQAMRYGDVWEFVKHTKAELLDEYSKFRADGTPVRYWLYKFPSGEIFTQDAYYMLYDDLVPGSSKQYMSGVEPFKTVPEAMAWKFSDDLFTVSPDEWKQLVPGIDMN